MPDSDITMQPKTSTFKKMRDALQQGIYCVINPFVRLLIRMGITPNIVTTIGLLGNIAAAALLVYAGYTGSATDMNYELVTWAGAIIILFSLFDMLDGQVARLGGMASTFGAMYDSVLDRYCELFTLGGISYYLDPDSGRMASDTEVVIGDRTYRASGSGRLEEVLPEESQENGENPETIGRTEPAGP